MDELSLLVDAKNANGAPTVRAYACLGSAQSRVAWCHVLLLRASPGARELREAQVRRDRFRERAEAEAEREHLLTELREAVQVRDAFLAIASDELKTPLTSLQLVAETMQKVEREGTTAKMPADWLATRLNVLVRQTKRLWPLIKGLDARTALSGRRHPSWRARRRGWRRCSRASPPDSFDEYP